MISLGQWRLTPLKGGDGDTVCMGVLRRPEQATPALLAQHKSMHPSSPVSWTVTQVPGAGSTWGHGDSQLLALPSGSGSPPALVRGALFPSARPSRAGQVTLLHADLGPRHIPSSASSDSFSHFLGPWRLHRAHQDGLPVLRNAKEQP